MFKKIGLGFKKIGVKGETHDEEFDEMKEQHSIEKKRVVQTKNNILAMIKKMKAFSKGFNHLGDGFITIFKEFSENGMDKDDQSEFSDLIYSFENDCKNYLDEIKDRCIKKTKIYKDDLKKAESLIFQRDDARISYDKQLQVVKRLEKRDSDEKGERKLEKEQDKLERLAGIYNDANQEAKDTLKEFLEKTRPKLYKIISKDFYTLTCALAKTYGDNMSALSDKLNEISSENSGKFSSEKVKHKKIKKVKNQEQDDSFKNLPRASRRVAVEKLDQMWKTKGEFQEDDYEEDNEEEEEVEEEPRRRPPKRNMSLRKPPPRRKEPPKKKPPKRQPPKNKPKPKRTKTWSNPFARKKPPKRKKVVKEESESDDDDGGAPPPPMPDGEMPSFKPQNISKSDNRARNNLFADINKGGFKLKKVKKSQIKRPKSPKSMAKEKESGKSSSGRSGFSGGGMMAEMMAKMQSRKNRR